MRDAYRSMLQGVRKKGIRQLTFPWLRLSRPMGWSKMFPYTSTLLLDRVSLFAPGIDLLNVFQTRTRSTENFHTRIRALPNSAL
jgi:hypothetical protein